MLSSRQAPHWTAFLNSDPDYAPFGIACLRGLTLARIGLVLLACTVFVVRNSTNAMFSAPFGEWLADVGAFLGTQFVSYVPMLIVVTIADNLTAGTSARRRIAWLACAVVVGSIAYTATYIALFPDFHPGYADLTMKKWALSVATKSLRALLYGGLFTTLLYFVRQERETSAELHRTQMNRLDLDREMTEAQLQALQAQIEPHFLFNTLATVRRLYQVDRTQGKRMIRDLSTYLRAALPGMRETSSTLRQELAMAQAYLDVQKVRMDQRLNVEVIVAPELLDASLPPMMLQTLVENAIKHGLNPLPQGGTIRIAVSRENADLKIEIADDGIGFQKTSGSGVGLANTRARLATLYGAQAHLVLDANPAGGVTATLTLPIRDGRAESSTP